MRRRLQLLKIIALSSVIIGCSANHCQKPTPTTGHGRDVDRLFGTWGAPDTTIILPNGHELYIFGQGNRKTAVTPITSIPGHRLFTLAEEGKPTKIVRYTRDPRTPPSGKRRMRTVWFKADPTGNILLAGCDGCSEAEDRALAAWDEGPPDEITWTVWRSDSSP